MIFPLILTKLEVECTCGEVFYERFRSWFQRPTSKWSYLIVRIVCSFRNHRKTAVPLHDQPGGRRAEYHLIDQHPLMAGNSIPLARHTRLWAIHFGNGWFDKSYPHTLCTGFRISLLFMLDIHYGDLASTVRPRGFPSSSPPMAGVLFPCPSW